MHPAYFKTVFEIPDTEPDWPHEFVIISAHATTGEHWSDERNDAADEALHRVLSDPCGWLTRVTGASPDGVHREPSWACDLSMDEALQVGREFAQDAIYAVCGDVLTVVGCTDGTSARVGPFRDRLRGRMERTD